MSQKKTQNSNTGFDTTIFKSFVKAMGSEDAHFASESPGANVNKWIDSGSTTLNAALSGSIRGGYPGNKIIGLGGDYATGKTYLMMSAIKSFLEEDPRAGAVIYDSESDMSEQLLARRGIDPRRVVVPVLTVEDFRTQAMKLVDRYAEIAEEKRPPLIIALDSLGNLSTKKEIEDIASGKDVVDMTKARLIKGTFRALTGKLGKLNLPMFVTNHTYMGIGMFASKKMGGGEGLNYAASTILFLSKKKDTEGSGFNKDVIGVELIALMKKSRNTKENKKVTTYLSYDNGLDAYYGLLEIALEGGVVKKIGKGEYEFPGGVVVTDKELKENPDTIYSEDVLDAIDEAAGKIFKYQGYIPPEEEILTKEEE